MEKSITNLHVFLNTKYKDKKELFKFIVYDAYNKAIVDDEKSVLKAFIHREKITSTGLEDQFAIPHAKCSSIKIPAIYFIANENMLKWKTFDNSAVKYIFALMIPEFDHDIHLSALSNIATKLMDADFRAKIKSVSSKEDLASLILSD